MSEQIKRYDPEYFHHEQTDGDYILYSDYVATKAADKAEIERLRSENVMIQAWRSRCELAEAKIAALEADRELLWRELSAWKLAMAQRIT